MTHISHADYLIPTYNLSACAEYVTTLRGTSENIDLWMVRAVRGVEYSSMEHSLTSQRILYEQSASRAPDPMEMARAARKLRELYRRVHIADFRYSPTEEIERMVAATLNAAGFDVNVAKALYLKLRTNIR